MGQVDIQKLNVNMTLKNFLWETYKDHRDERKDWHISDLIDKYADVLTDSFIEKDKRFKEFKKMVSEYYTYFAKEDQFRAIELLSKEESGLII